MAIMLLALLISCMTVLVYGLPVAPPKRVVEKFEDRKVNPEERGGGIEGDMLIPSSNRKGQFRGAAVLSQHKWPNNVSPYDISAITDSNDRNIITEAMNTLMYDTGTPSPKPDSPAWRYYCVYFRPREATDNDFLTIQYGTGCSAHVGYWPNFRVTMTLEKGDCFHSGVIQHELMHVLGFQHEQSRPDRDNYIDIYLQNVAEHQRHNFKKVEQVDLTNLNSQYDYASIMHYGTNSFSGNGAPTIVPKQTGVTIGEQKQLSPIDIAEVRQFYGCT